MATRHHAPLNVVALIGVFAVSAAADEIPDHAVRGELAGKAWVPDRVEVRLDGNHHWRFRAVFHDEMVKLDLPISFAPATGECIERPLAQIDGAYTDMRSGKDVWSANAAFTLRFTSVAADRAIGTIDARFSPLPIGGAAGWFAGTFDAPIHRVEEFGSERACTKAENQPLKTQFAGAIGETKLSAKNWELAELPDDMLRTHHWRLRAGQLGIDLDGAPTIGCKTRTITGRQMEAFVGLDPLGYVVAFDSITTDRATGWVRYVWEDNRASGAGRFEAKIVHEQPEKDAPDPTRLCR